MREPLEFLWPIVEAVNPIVTPDALWRWPSEIREPLMAARLLTPAGTAESIRCPACSRVHKGKPFDRKSANGEIRHFIRCPEVLRAEVTSKHMQQWAVDVGAVVSALATALSLSGACKNLESDRVWRCGRTRWGGVVRDVLFARGLIRQDADRFRRAITACHRPIVLVGAERPPPAFWQGHAHSVVALAALVHLREGQITVELDALAAAIQDADDEGSPDRTAAINVKDLKLMIRQEVKSDKKSELTDEMVLAAYVTHGTARAAADALAKDGHKIHFSTVTRIVNRMQGTTALARGESSESIVRHVASQRRNSRKKIQNTPEAKDFQ